jgi:transcriptional regulator with XRE-family HTH domain
MTTTPQQRSLFGDLSRHTLGGRLRLIREARGLKVRQLARLAKVDHQVILNLEAGRTDNPMLKTLLALQRALGLSSIELLLGGQLDQPSWEMANELD